MCQSIAGMVGTVAMDDMNAAMNEAYRRISNLVRIGTIDEVDHAHTRARVDFGGFKSAWLPWMTARAGASGLFWHAPAVGEQVVVIAPDGDPAQGVVAGAVYGGANVPSKGVANIWHLNMPADGQFIVTVGGKEMIRLTADSFTSAASAVAFPNAG